MRRAFATLALAAAAFLSLTGTTSPVAVAASTASAASEGLAVGQEFPDLAASGVAGAIPADLKGKIVIMDFCASWCAPCHAAFVTYERLSKEFGPQGLVVVAISVDDRVKDFEAMAKKLKPTFPLLHDRQKKLVEVVRVPKMPTSYILDHEGNVRFVHAGFDGDATERLLRTHIQTLLAARAAAVSTPASVVSPAP